MTTENNTDVASYVWQSGNWQKTPNSKAPFNGLQITAVPTFDQKGQFQFLLVTFLDFTTAAAGVKYVMPNMTPSNDWVVINPVKIELNPKAKTAKENEKVKKIESIALKNNDLKNKLKITLKPKDEVPYLTVKGKVILKKSNNKLQFGINLRIGLSVVGGEEFGNIFTIPLPVPQKTTPPKQLKK